MPGIDWAYTGTLGGEALEDFAATCLCQRYPDARQTRTATKTGLQITVCHLPPGTSKWNKIEHRLFSHISMNWRGRPLTSHEVIVNTIAAATTKTGLRVHAELDENHYPAGIKIPDKQMRALETDAILNRHDWHPEWQPGESGCGDLAAEQAEPDEGAVGSGPRAQDTGAPIAPGPGEGWNGGHASPSRPGTHARGPR